MKNNTHGHNNCYRKKFLISGTLLYTILVCSPVGSYAGKLHVTGVKSIRSENSESESL